MGKRRNLLSEDELKIVTKTSYVESDELAFKLFFEGEVLARASSFLLYMSCNMEKKYLWMLIRIAL
ncbi:hypothetical protein P4555_20125 [Peribacillus frigoritolerans]|uniref:hypothetical protein n=1 Tax=Peribacillus frigoritolerans TaxID=450367 RepID=UPI002E252080|nr:hypothetical protein [Peribacillus frigoritolerans]